MNRNEYKEIINGADTYKTIANMLLENGSILVGWTDQAATHVDILFVYDTACQVSNYLTIQRGIRPSDLFVCIMSRGAFGFEIDNTNTSAGHYAEKLNLDGWGSTVEALAELINGVKKAIPEAQNEKTNNM